MKKLVNKIRHFYHEKKATKYWMKTHYYPERCYWNVKDKELFDHYVAKAKYHTHKCCVTKQTF